jgi:GNAT superfamily N-acetyltransferase
MADIGRYRAEDRRALEALYRRVFGQDAADVGRLRWDWLYRANPATAPDTPPLIFVAREGTGLVGQLATLPVRLHVRGREVDAAWGTDAMVTPERQRQGLGELLVRQWEAGVGAALAIGQGDSSTLLLRKLRWPLVPVPCLVKPLTRRAFRMPNWSVTTNRLVSAVTLPLVKVLGRARPMAAEIQVVRRFDDTFTAFWERVAPSFDLAVCRDAPYLNWKYATPPHVRYHIATLRRAGAYVGYIVYRHVHEPLGRVTLIVDFLVEPGDSAGLRTLLGWVDREARAADSDKIRCHALHEGFRRGLRRSGYLPIKSSLDFIVRINAIELPASFYGQTERWHVTAGDGDHDR